MPPEFCLFMIGGKEMLLYLIGHREQSKPGFAFVFASTQQELHRTQRTQDRLSK